MYIYIYMQSSWTREIEMPAIYDALRHHHFRISPFKSLIFTTVFKSVDALLGGGFKYFLFSPLFGEDSHFDDWNHKLV